MKKLYFNLFFILFFLVSAYSQVGIGTDQPTEELDVVGDVRVRGINLNLGNSETDKRVVADGDGVLKTLPIRDPRLVNGDLEDNVYSTIDITAPANGLSNTNTMEVFNFQIFETSLVTFSYDISISLVTPEDWRDDYARIVTNHLILTNGPSTSNNLLNKRFARSNMIIQQSNGSGGRNGFYFNTSSYSFVLSPGSYTFELQGGIINSDQSVTARFGNFGSMTVTAIPVAIP